MTDTITPKTQEEWLEYFKQLAKEHGEMLAQPFVDFFADKILLTKKEVEEAREDIETTEDKCTRFLRAPDWCERNFEGLVDEQMRKAYGYCRLCLKLTQFAKGGEDG